MYRLMVEGIVIAKGSRAQMWAIAKRKGYAVWSVYGCWELTGDCAIL